ncbi:ribonuclease III [Neisseriaceae bacterium ESL0693]|nr:ribonuclease III [Neisseriaceae bacterium ESL0693]
MNEQDQQHLQARRHIETKLGYTFTKPALLEQALTHRSFSARHNERFEFIGDSILNYTVAKMLFMAFPRLSEGELSRLRANLVNQETLAEIALELNVGDALLLGSGELKSGGFRRPSTLADAMEAMFAAISFDADFNTAETVIQRLYKSRIRLIDPKNSGKDAKTRLQEALQARHWPLPKYRIMAQIGDVHDQRFVVQCDLGELGFQTEAEGHSRREAEQQTAKAAIAWLDQHHPVSKSGKKKSC